MVYFWTDDDLKDKSFVCVVRVDFCLKSKF